MSKTNIAKLAKDMATQTNSLLWEKDEKKRARIIADLQKEVKALDSSTMAEYEREKKAYDAGFSRADKSISNVESSRDELLRPSQAFDSNVGAVDRLMRDSMNELAGKTPKLPQRTNAPTLAATAKPQESMIKSAERAASTRPPSTPVKDLITFPDDIKSKTSPSAEENRGKTLSDEEKLDALFSDVDFSDLDLDDLLADKAVSQTESEEFDDPFDTLDVLDIEEIPDPPVDTTDYSELEEYFDKIAAKEGSQATPKATNPQNIAKQSDMKMAVQSGRAAESKGEKKDDSDYNIGPKFSK